MIKRFLLGLISLLLTHQAIAALDPIGWSVDQALPNNVTTGTTYIVTYTFKNQLPFQLVKPLIIEIAANSPEFTYTNNCHQKLTPNQTCTVIVTLIPSTPGLKEVQLTLAGYSKDRVPLPKLRTMSTIVSVIEWQKTPPLPQGMTIGDKRPYEFTYTNTGTETVTGISLSSNYVNFSTTCSASLLPGASCTAGGEYTATETSPTTVHGYFAYGGAATPVDAYTTTSLIPATGITVTLTPGLPAVTLTATQYPVNFKFTNNGPTDVCVAQSNSFPSEYTVSSNSCSSMLPACGLGGVTFAANSHCTIEGKFLAPLSFIYSITASLVYAIPPYVTSATTATITQTTSTGDRTFTFTNQCTFPVWFSLHGGNLSTSPLPVCAPNPLTNDGCPIGTSCNFSTKACFWNNYGPTGTNKNNQLNTGDSATVIIPAISYPTPPPNPQEILWSGTASASTLCDGESYCGQADCQNGGGYTSCAVGVGFQPPATQAEFTLLANGIDSYDVEVIDGFHIPIEMTPTSGVIASGWTCGSSGNPSVTDQLGACNWTTSTPPSPQSAYYWVTTTPASPCSPNDTCTNSKQLCGLDINIDKHCGNFLGYWTGNRACTINQTKAKTYFNCTTALGTPFVPNTLPYDLQTQYRVYDLYQCKPPNATSLLNSCYNFPNTGTNSNCCGCKDWSTIPGITLPEHTVSCAGTSDPQWLSWIEPTIEWMKQACPSYYIYPFDDKSSSFTCSNTTPPATNSLGYTITFCPGGNTGLPTHTPTYTDGR